MVSGIHAGASSNLRAASVPAKQGAQAKAGSPPQLNRRVLFHEAREALQEAIQQMLGRNDEPSMDEASVLNQRRNAVQAIAAGVRRTRWKVMFVEALQERKNRRSRSRSQSKAKSFDEAPHLEVPTAHDKEKASPEEPELAVELGTTVDAFVETFSRLHHLEGFIQDPVMKGSFAEVLESAEHCTKLLCCLKSSSVGLIDDIMKLDEERVDACQVASRLLEQLNADIARLHNVLQEEEKSAEEASGNLRSGRRGRAMFLQAASHCLYALGILKEETSKPQRRFAINAGEEIAGALTSNSFSAAWEAAKRTRQAMFQSCKLNRQRYEGADGNQSDSDSGSDDENETSKGGWLRKILSQLNECGEEGPHGLSAEDQESTSASRPIGSVDTDDENADQVEVGIVKPPGSPSSSQGCRGTYRAHRPRYTAEKASTPKNRSKQSVEAPVEVSQVPKGSPRWRTVADQQHQQPQQPDLRNGSMSAGEDRRHSGGAFGEAACRTGRYLTRTYNARRKTAGIIHVHMALLDAEDEDEDYLQQPTALIRAKSCGTATRPSLLVDCDEGTGEPMLLASPRRQRLPTDSSLPPPTAAASIECPAIGKQKRNCRARTMKLHLDGTDSADGDSNNDDRTNALRAKSVEAKGVKEPHQPHMQRMVCPGIVSRSAQVRAGLSSFAQAVNMNKAPTPPKTPPPQTTPRRARQVRDLPTLVGRKDLSPQEAKHKPIVSLKLKHGVINGSTELEDDSDGFVFPSQWTSMAS